MLEPLRMIPGPWFLLLLFVLSMLGIVLNFVLGLRSNAVDPRVDESLSPYEIAYLAGGSRRVIETALTVAHASGVIRITPKRMQVKPVDTARTDDPVVRELLEELGKSKWPSQELELARSLQGIRHRLTESGFLESTLPRKFILHACATFGLLQAIAAAKLWLGITHGEPYLFLLMAIIALWFVFPFGLALGILLRMASGAGYQCINRRKLMMEPMLFEERDQDLESRVSPLMTALFGFRRLSTISAWAAAIPLAGIVVAANPTWWNPRAESSASDGSFSSGGGTDAGCGGGSSGGDSGCGGGGGCGGCGGGGGGGD